MVRLQSGTTDLDLGEFSTTLTFSIADIREPDKRNASFSKTLTLPGTKANNKFFENMFEVDVVTQTFNPNLKAKTILSVDGVTQFRGALKLRQVNYLLSGEVSYDCNLIGNLADLIQALGTSTLRDLDLSAYDHVFNQANIEASWTPTLGTGYVYPMINYGETFDLTVWDVGLFRPAPFIKTIWDKIMSTAGFSYSSSFLNATLFKSLVMPNSNDKLRLTGTQVDTRLFNAGRTTAQTFSNIVSGIIGTFTVTETTAQINNDSAGQYFDNGGTFNTTLYRHEPNYAGFNNYIFTCDVQFDIDKTFSGTTLANEYAGELLVEIIRLSSLGVETSLNSFFLNLTDFAADPAGTYTLTGTVEVAAENVAVMSGDVIYVKFSHAAEAVFNSTGADWSITNISFRDSVANNILNLGDTLILSNSLPDMTQKDFVMGVVKMFNLYIEPDANDELLLNIEPRDDYYNTTQVDWTEKLDTSKKLEIEPMALLNFKRLTCSYKADSDYYNKVYKGEYARVYGDYRADIDNDFVNGEYKVETNFAPTPLVGGYDSDRIIPTIYAANGNPPAIELITGLPRILYWGGLKSCEQWNFRFFNTDNYKTQYPYAGHLDDPTAPTIDLSFGVPLKVYYGVNQFIPSLTYTDNNLYNGYYAQMISEITDRDSKLVTGYFWLTPVDILNLDFRKIYRVGSHALRLNKIYDYNPVKSNLTKCEFIKIKDTNSFASASEIMNGGIDVVINSREDTPVIDMSSFQGGNTVARPSSTVITGEKNYAGGGLSTWIGGRNNRVHGRDSSGVAVFGEDNIVQDAASGVAIFGYQNNVGFGAKNLFIQGKNNTINPSISNVTLINTNNETVTENDLTYLVGKKVYSNTVYYRTSGQSFSNSKTLNFSPHNLSEFTAPGATYFWNIKEIRFYLDAGGIQYDFANPLQFRYATSGNIIAEIPIAVINAATDQYYVVVPSGVYVSINEAIQLYSATDATVGTGIYWFQLIYNKTTFLE